MVLSGGLMGFKKEVEILEKELNNSEGYFYYGRWYDGKKNKK